MLVTRIAELIHGKILDEVSDLRDESDENTRIVVELKRDAVTRVAINKLYKNTQLESSFGVIMLALHQRRPRQMNIKELLECYIEHRREVVTRRTEFRLGKAEVRAHILTGFQIALDNLDEFVRIIRAANNRDDAKIALMTRFPLSEQQTLTILELRLYQLTGMERNRIDSEYAELCKTIEGYRRILGNDTILLDVVKEELTLMRDKYASPRMTSIEEDSGEFKIEDVIANECCAMTVTSKGFIKRTPVSSYRSQKRGGKGVIGAGQHEEDSIEHFFTANTHDNIMFVMDSGRVYVEKAYEIPDGSRTSKGRAIVNLVDMQPDEKIAAVLCFQDFLPDKYLVICTKNGIVKKTCLEAYKNVRCSGIVGIQIDGGDSLIEAVLTNNSNELVMITSMGMSIRFHESDLRDQGRSTRGVRGISLKSGDAVCAMTIVDDSATFLLAADNGQGKRSKFDEYRLQKRGGSGVIAMKLRSGVRLTGALTVSDSDEIMMITDGGQAIRSPVSGIRVIGRTTQGVRLIALSNNDKLIGISKILNIQDK
jgi:DNA gyrase subunit A